MDNDLIKKIEKIDEKYLNKLKFNLYKRRFKRFYKWCNP